MDWTHTAQIVAIVIAYVGGLVGVARFVTHSLGKRIDDLKSKTESDNLAIVRMMQGLDKRIDDLNANINARFEEMNTNINARFSEMNANINNRIDDIRNQMQREHDNLSNKIDAHISDQQASG